LTKDLEEHENQEWILIGFSSLNITKTVLVI
jgi:hypothetical protein